MTAAIEQNARRSPSNVAREVVRSVKNALIKTGAYLYIPGMMDRTTKELYLKSGYENITLLEAPLKAGKNLLIVYSHQSLGDGGPALDVADEVGDRHPEYVKKFRYILSKTIGNGKQGESTRNYSYARGRFLRKHHAKALEVASTKDESERDTFQGFGDTRAVMEAVKEPGVAVMLHIEANMNGGRINEATGEINGMGHMDANARAIVMKLLGIKPKTGERGKHRTPIVFLPVGIDGSHKLYSPDTRAITREGWEIILQEEVASFLRDPNSFPQPVGTIRVEKPFTDDEILDSSDPIAEIELRVAKALPPHARGIFKDALRGVR